MSKTAAAVTETIDRAEIRRRLKAVSAEEFEKAHTRAVLDEMAQTMEVDAEKLSEASNKGEVVALIIANADLPDPSLRGSSDVEAPVAVVWNYCDEHREAYASGEKRRKDLMDELQAMGVTFYTARTQIQAWRSATLGPDGNFRALDDLAPDELPRQLRPEEEETEASDE